MTEADVPQPKVGEGESSEERVILEDISEKTGHVLHDGLLRITGSIRDGMTVVGQAGIVMHGNVHRGKILSEKDIVISGNVLGEGETIIKAGGKLIVGNLFGADVVAHTIITSGAIRNCRIEAMDIIQAESEEDIEVSFSKVRVGNQVIANALGAVGDKETVVDVELAEKNRIVQDLVSVEEAIERDKVELEKLMRVVGMVRLMGEKVRTLNAEKQADLKRMLQRVMEIQDSLKERETRREDLNFLLDEIADPDKKYPVEVRKRVLRGVRIRIDGSELEMSESLASGACFYKKKRVVFKLV
jgi:uncharacterized protein